MTEGLLDALTLPEKEARVAWQQWRDATDIDTLPHAAQQLLPALNARLPEWLAGDPHAGILQGIVRQVWTQNQLRLRKALDIVRLLKSAGVAAPIVAGPVAWSLQASAPAIRTIPCLTFLVPRGDVRKSAAALEAAGWHAYAQPPSEDGFDWCEQISFTQDNVPLLLHWRLIPTAAHDAVDCETEMLQGLRGITWNQQPLQTTSREATLVEITCANRIADLLPWQADMELVGTSGVDWEIFRKFAARFAPLALERTGQSAPELAPWQRKLESARGKYRELSYRRKQPADAQGFLRYVAEQWQVHSLWQLPIVGARRAWRHGRSLLR